MVLQELSSRSLLARTWQARESCRGREYLSRCRISLLTSIYSLEPDWKEEEIFRIDHYLGKEMVKNLLILRFGNEFLGATWNRNHIDSVQITFKEPFGTEGRGGYFDEFGIIRDVMQNHLLQVLTLLAMERPISFSAEDIRDEKVRVLRGIHAIEPKNVIIGQYGKSLDGSKPSYKEDDSVPKDSRCPTFASMVLF